MVKISEKKTGDGKKFRVKIEKLRTGTSTYKILNFTIYLNGNIVYRKSDFKNIYD